jgi:hypothetical protein
MPLVVSSPAGNGWIVHSVPHWWQDLEPDTTELGLRSLRLAPFISGDVPDNVTWGSYGAALSLLTVLLAGIGRSAERFDRDPAAGCGGDRIR